VVSAAKRYGCRSIAYTYTEPTVFFEYAYETARLANEHGIRNIFVTNGYIGEEALRAIRPYLDAANIDLKSFSDEFYKKNCGARLQPVLDNIRLHKELGIWIEVTTLIIPTLNDTEEELRSIARFIKSVGEEIPWHVSQFHPMYRLLDLPRTPVSTLRNARKIGIEEGLRYVYMGNVPGEGGESTYCYRCNERLIHRFGYEILENRIKDSSCPKCGAPIDGIGMAQ
jgi:pyruvate formate lyase activating enzyme